MTNTQYHADTSAISKSGLDLISESPADYFQKYALQNFSDETSEEVALGSAFHCLLFEPENLHNLYIVSDTKIDKRTAQGKMHWATLQQEAGMSGKKVLDIKMFETASKMRDAVMLHPIAKELLSRPGKSEYMYSWIDPETGVQCKAKADRITANRLIIDAKSTANVSPNEFSRSCYNYRYHVQDAFYSDGFELAHGVPVEGFVFIAVRNTAPHLVSCYILDDDARNLGRETYKFDLQVYAQCKSENRWPAYPNDTGVISMLGLPKFAFNQ